MRKLHYQPNWDHCPVINTDKLWTLVSEETRKAAQAKKGEDLEASGLIAGREADAEPRFSGSMMESLSDSEGELPLVAVCLCGY